MALSCSAIPEQAKDLVRQVFHVNILDELSKPEALLLFVCNTLSYNSQNNPPFLGQLLPRPDEDSQEQSLSYQIDWPTLTLHMIQVRQS